MMSSREMRFTTHSGALFAVTAQMKDLRRGGKVPAFLLKLRNSELCFDKTIMRKLTMKLLGLRNQISIHESVRHPGLSRSVIRLNITAIIGLPFTDTVIDEVGGVVVTQPSLNWPSS